MASVGVILGAGGVAGAAWHAGALAALADAGWDARSADLLVGTSAGSGVAAVLRLGIPPTDLAARPLGRPMTEAGAAHAERAGPLELPVPDPLAGLPLPVAPQLALRTLARPWPLRPMVALSGLLPAGRVPTAAIGDRIRRLADDRWPDRRTWICAVRLSDGRRVVFGRDVEDADLATAVEASSAIPGYFRPVRHAGETYVDGGAHSPTNADLAADLGFDVVVVSSPMSGTRAALRRLRWSGARGLHARTLAQEVRAVRAAGTPVLVLQPGPDMIDLVGPNAMEPGNRGAIVRLAHRTVADHLVSGRVDDRLALLRS